MHLNKKILIAFFIFILCFSLVASTENFGYNYLKGQLNVNQEVNYSTLHVNNSQYLRGLTPQEVANLYVETDPIFDSWLDIPLLENPLNIQRDVPDPLTPMLNISNSNTYGTSFLRFQNDIGHQLDLGTFGYNVSQSQFGDQLNINDSAIGISSRGSPIWIATRDNKSILFGGSPNDNINETVFSIKIDPELQALIFQGNKYIRPVKVDGGFALVFQSLEVLEAGGFPFVWVAKDSNNQTIVSSWFQNGNNNSFSGTMNSFGLVPKSWVSFEGQPLQNDTEGVEFLFNTSNYLNYCNYLQDNLSLIPEGCKYYADTTTRLVPLGFFGDLEVHRSAVIHEGLTVFEDLDFIGRNGNDVDLLFNGGLENGQLHIRDKRQILENITNFNRVICNFDDTTLCSFVSESILPEPGRDWESVNDIECHEDRCARAQGGNSKVMCISDGTQNAQDINISFWLTTTFSILDSFTVELDDNLGNTTTIFTETNSVLDTFNYFIMPSLYENKSNITTCFTLDGQNANREAWVDIVKVEATFNPAVEINDTFDGGRTIWGENMNSLSCAIDVGKQINNDTLQSEWVMEIGCPSGVTKILGNATFVDTTFENQTIIGDSHITGDLTVDGLIYGNGSQLTDIAAGSDGEVQFNDGGAHGADNELVWDNVNKRLGIGTDTPSKTLDINGSINIPTTTSTKGIIFQDGTRILNTFVPSDQTPTWANIFIGGNSGSFLLDNSVSAFHGTGNVGIGANTLDSLTTGYYNFALGTFALGTANTGHSNVGVGHQAGKAITTGNENVLLGRDSGVRITTGRRNLGLGMQPLVFLTSGNENVALGYRAGFSSTTSSNNIFLGSKAGFDATTGNQNILIGYNVQKPTITDANKLNIGDTIYGDLSTDQIGIGTNAPQNTLDVSGGQVIGSTYAGVNTAPTDGLLVEGNVGIGTTTPLSSFHLVDSINSVRIGGTIGMIFQSNNDIPMRIISNDPISKISISDSDSTSSTDAGIRVTGDRLSLDTDAVERLSVDVNGNVGIGTNAPQNTLDVSGGQVIGSTYAGVNTAPTDGLLVEGNVGIGTNNPNVELEVIGNGNFTGNITSNFHFLGNGAYIGYNATCQMIFYNSTGGVMSTQGCV